GTSNAGRSTSWRSTRSRERPGPRSAESTIGVRPRPSSTTGLRRPSLLTAFALVSLLPLALLGYGLSGYLKHQIRSRAYGDARQSAALVAAAVQTQLTPYEFRRGLGQSDLLALDRTVDGLKSRGVADVRLSDGRGHVLYAQD